MVERQTKVRHVRGVGDMTEGAWRVFLTLSFILVWALILSVWAFNDARETRTALEKTQTELTQERIAKNVEQVSRCRAAITTTITANRVIYDQRQTHIDRANQIKKIRSTDRSKQLYAIHTEIIVSERKKAAELKPFPVITKAQCDQLAKKLGVSV